MSSSSLFHGGGGGGRNKALFAQAVLQHLGVQFDQGDLSRLVDGAKTSVLGTAPNASSGQLKFLLANDMLAVPSRGYKEAFTRALLDQLGASPDEALLGTAISKASDDLLVALNVPRQGLRPRLLIV